MSLSLAISTDSFHYRYYQLLRRIWNFDEERDRTSLCTYTQFMFWFSLWTLLCFPCILGGWLLLKTGRFFYKVCSWTPVGRKILDTFDSFGMGNKIDELSDKMAACPAFTLSLIFLKVCLYVLVATFVLSLLIGGVVYIKTICMFVIAAVMVLCLGFFYICFGIGWGLVHSAAVICFVVKWAVLWIAGYAFFILMFFVAIVVASLFGMIMIKLFTASEKVMDFLGFRLNGYHEARKASASRKAENKRKREEALEKLRLARWEVKRQKAAGEIPYTIGERFKKWSGKVCAAGVKHLGEFFVAKTKNIGNGSVKVISGFGVVWLTLKSIKQGICPLVEFVDGEEFDKEEPE